MQGTRYNGSRKANAPPRGSMLLQFAVLIALFLATFISREVAKFLLSERAKSVEEKYHEFTFNDSNPDRWRVKRKS